MKRTALRNKSLKKKKKSLLHTGGLFPKVREVKHNVARRRAAEAFQRYVRFRDAIRTTGGIKFLRCITCDKTYPTIGKGCAQGGHFIPGRHGAILFDERNCHGQCYVCNVILRGNWVEYRRKMILLYGEKVVKELEALNGLTIQHTVPELLALEKEYLSKIDSFLQKYS